MKFEEKLKRLIKTKYGKYSDLSKKFGMNYSQLSQYLNGKKISIEFLNNIIQEFPETDLNWLLRDDAKIAVGDDRPSYPYKPVLTRDEIITKIELLLQELKTESKA